MLLLLYFLIGIICALPLLSNTKGTPFMIILIIVPTVIVCWPFYLLVFAIKKYL